MKAPLSTALFALMFAFATVCTASDPVKPPKLQKFQSNGGALAFSPDGGLYLTGFCGASAALARVDFGRRNNTFSIVAAGGSFQGAALTGLTVDEAGQPYVSEYDFVEPASNQLVKIDPLTGNRVTLVNSGLLGTEAAYGLAYGGGSAILAATSSFISGILRGLIVTADTVTGAQNLFYSRAGARLRSVAVTPNGDALVVGVDDVLPTVGYLLSVGPPEAVISSGGWLTNPRSIALDVDGEPFVLNVGPSVGGSSDVAIVAIDLGTGQQSVVASGGYLNGNPAALTVGPDGNFYVLSMGSVAKVLRASGEQSIAVEFSKFGCECPAAGAGPTGPVVCRRVK